MNCINCGLLEDEHWMPGAYCDATKMPNYKLFNGPVSKQQFAGEVQHEATMRDAELPPPSGVQTGAAGVGEES